jgi:peptidoglycan hydrolase-like protein with peptidoglycan-binding domain
VLAAGPVVASAQSLGSPALVLGMRGPEVRTLQVDLTLSGFATGESGVFNHATRREVIAFQRRFGLSADGVVGPATAGQLVAVAKAKTALKSSSTPASATTSNGAASLATASSSKTSAPSTTAAGTSASTAGTPAAGTSTSPTTTTSTSTITTGTSTITTGGAGMGTEPNSAPVESATLNADGLAVAPADAPPVIAEVIAAANQIAFLPYIYGGGHSDYQGNPVALDAGYDCSGSVSFALHGANLLSEPLDSTEFESWGTPGAGQWITLWTNAGHVYMNVAGLWFDTAAQSAANGEDRWSTTRISSASGFMELHPTGW